MEENKAKSFLEKLKEKARQQENYGGKVDAKNASMGTTECPNCGASRAKHDGLTHCAYCGHEFLSVTLSEGLNIKKEDNSR